MRAGPDVGVLPGAVAAEFRDLLAAGAEKILRGELEAVGRGGRGAGGSGRGPGGDAAFGCAGAAGVVDVLRGRGGQDALHRAEAALGVVDVLVEQILNHVARRVVGKAGISIE